MWLFAPTSITSHTKGVCGRSDERKEGERKGKKKPQQTEVANGHQKVKGIKESPKKKKNRDREKRGMAYKLGGRVVTGNAIWSGRESTQEKNPTRTTSSGKGKILPYLVVTQTKKKQQHANKRKKKRATKSIFGVYFQLRKREDFARK